MDLWLFPALPILLCLHVKNAFSYEEGEYLSNPALSFWEPYMGDVCSWIFRFTHPPCWLQKHSFYLFPFSFPHFFSLLCSWKSLSFAIDSLCQLPYPLHLDFTLLNILFSLSLLLCLSSSDRHKTRRTNPTNSCFSWHIGLLVYVYTLMLYISVWSLFCYCCHPMPDYM